MPTWKTLCAVEDIPVLGARRVTRRAGADLAVFRTADDRVFALLDRCPHKGGPLSPGIVHGERVACPLHGWSIGLADGTAAAPDEGTTPVFAVRVVDGRVMLDADEVATRAVDTTPSRCGGGCAAASAATPAGALAAAGADAPLDAAVEPTA